MVAVRNESSGRDAHACASANASPNSATRSRASYATVDFDFMCGVSLASLVVVFVPTLLIAIYAFDAAPAALLVAMYAPHLALVPVFGGRLIYNARRMLRGEAGPWNEYDKTAAASAKLSDSMSAQDGVAALHSGEI